MKKTDYIAATIDLIKSLADIAHQNDLSPMQLHIRQPTLDCLIESFPTCDTLLVKDCPRLWFDNIRFDIYVSGELIFIGNPDLIDKL